MCQIKLHTSYQICELDTSDDYCVLKSEYLYHCEKMENIVDPQKRQVLKKRNFSTVIYRLKPSNYSMNGARKYKLKIVFLFLTKWFMLQFLTI